MIEEKSNGEKRIGANRKPLTLLVLAAGMGSRYGGIKQIDGFGPSGETIMDYSLYDAIRAGFTKVIFIVREDILETVREKFAPRLKGKLEVDFVVQSLDRLIPPNQRNQQRVKPWGTAHALLCAREKVHGPFVIINADDFYGKESFKSIADFFAADTNGYHAMVGYTLKNVLSEHGSVSRGVGDADASGSLISINERKKVVWENGKIVSKEANGDVVLSPDAPTAMNFFGFQPTIFAFAQELFTDFLAKNATDLTAEFYLPLTVNELVRQKKGTVKVIGGGDIWFGLTYKEDKEFVAKSIRDLIAKGHYPSKLWD